MNRARLVATNRPCPRRRSAYAFRHASPHRNPHVVTTTRTHKGKTYRTHLLRRSYREDDKVKNETPGNLSHLPEPLIDVIRRSLQGETFVALGQAFEIIGSRAHGQVHAVAPAMQILEFAGMLAAKPSRQRDLMLATVGACIVAPHTKLATTRWWHTTTLAQEFGVTDANEDDLHAAMDWLLARQERIEKNLAARHSRPGGLVLYDLSSSYFEGACCPLARLGHRRDGKKGLLPINCVFRPMTDRIPERWRTPFRWHGGQCSARMADSFGVGPEGCPP